MAFVELTKEDSPESGFERFKRMVHQTYQKNATLEKFEELEKLQKQYNGKELLLDGGSATYMFKKDDNNFFVFTVNGEKNETLNYKEAYELADRCYHGLNFHKKFGFIPDKKILLQNGKNAEFTGKYHKQQSINNPLPLYKINNKEVIYKVYGNLFFSMNEKLLKGTVQPRNNIDYDMFKKPIQTKSSIKEFKKKRATTTQTPAKNKKELER